MKRVLILFIALSTTFIAFASEKDSLWNNASTAYTGGNYDVALQDYLQIEQLGYSSADLMYNIGNCYYKLGNNVGKSILYYERALRIDPSSEDIQFNLNLAKQYTTDRIDVVPEFVLIIWVKNFREHLSSNTWSYLFLFFIFIVVMSLLIFHFGRGLALRKVMFIAAILFFIFALVSLSFSISLSNELKRDDIAIIMKPVSSVKSSPNESGQSLFIIHEGTKVEIIESLGEWDRVELEDGRQGWLLKGDIEVI